MCITAVTVIFIAGCSRQTPPIAMALDGVSQEFLIHWPPVAPEKEISKTRKPLLLGKISVQEYVAADDNHALNITLSIQRPSDEEGRKFWNEQLAFSEVPWMDKVRVWDVDEKWQWPNLPFLLRRHGVERVERYGGVDPGKLVDNDFAAVLIRRFDKQGNVESEQTANSPLVSAEWRGTDDTDATIHSVVHNASCEAFRVSVGKSTEHVSGMVKVWLVYADFLGSRPPSTWPREEEWAGGILAYCEIVWDKLPGESCTGTLRFKTPPTATDFAWEKWSEDPAEPAKSRLTDI